MCRLGVRVTRHNPSFFVRYDFSSVPSSPFLLVKAAVIGSAGIGTALGSSDLVEHVGT